MEVACSARDDRGEKWADDRDVCEASITNPGLKLNASGYGGKDDNVGQPEFELTRLFLLFKLRGEQSTGQCSSQPRDCFLLRYSRTRR